MAEGEAAWREIVSDVSSTSTNRRIRAWEKISAASHGAGPEEEGGDGDGVRAENAILAIEIAAGVYSDKVSKAALRKAIRSWIKSEDFVKLSVVAVAKRQKEIARYVLPSHQRYILMDWVCSLIVKLRESKQLKAENAMIATASRLLTAALQDSRRVGPRCGSCTSASRTDSSTPENRGPSTPSPHDSCRRPRSPALYGCCRRGGRCSSMAPRKPDLLS